MPHFIRTRLFEKAPFFVLIDRTTGGAKLKKASNINGFRIKDNSVRSEGRTSRSPVLQALNLPFALTNPETDFGFWVFFFIRTPLLGANWARCLIHYLSLTERRLSAKRGLQCGGLSVTIGLESHFQKQKRSEYNVYL